MDGIHDLGGRQGFGPIEVDEMEEPFHEPWEGRVRGIVNAMGPANDWNLDWFRHCRELIEPMELLFEVWGCVEQPSLPALWIDDGEAARQTALRWIGPGRVIGW